MVEKKKKRRILLRKSYHSSAVRFPTGDIFKPIDITWRIRRSQMAVTTYTFFFFFLSFFFLFPSSATCPVVRQWLRSLPDEIAKWSLVQGRKQEEIRF